jgi:hypothetical protein
MREHGWVSDGRGAGVRGGRMLLASRRSSFSGIIKQTGGFLFLGGGAIMLEFDDTPRRVCDM